MDGLYVSHSTAVSSSGNATTTDTGTPALCSATGDTYKFCDTKKLESLGSVTTITSSSQFQFGKHRDPIFDRRLPPHMEIFVSVLGQFGAHPIGIGIFPITLLGN